MSSEPFALVYTKYGSLCSTEPVELIRFVGSLRKMSVAVPGESETGPRLAGHSKGSQFISAAASVENVCRNDTKAHRRMAFLAFRAASLGLSSQL